ncbi:MAG TPA: hypothetical protein VN361_09255 [Oxalicibacterium sp.]|nr:hypothetical protein [Oxalicibacterium sp.]
MRKTICAALALCLLACSRGELPRGPNHTDAQARHEEAPLRDNEFDMTVGQFVQAFNAAARSWSHPYRIAEAELRRGALHNYFEQSFSGDVSLRANVEKDSGRISSITVLASGRKHEADRDALLAIAEILVLATEPDMPKKKAQSMITDMLNESHSTPEVDRLPQRYFEHARYVLRDDNDGDYWWVVSPN